MEGTQTGDMGSHDPMFSMSSEHEGPTAGGGSRHQEGLMGWAHRGEGRENHAISSWAAARPPAFLGLQPL